MPQGRAVMPQGRAVMPQDKKRTAKNSTRQKFFLNQQTASKRNIKSKFKALLTFERPFAVPTA
jgi:hypothetical protein